MAGFKYERFVGQFPARSKRLLAPNAAVTARDMRLGNGEILPLGEHSFEYSFTRPSSAGDAFTLVLSPTPTPLTETVVFEDSGVVVSSPELTSADWISASSPAAEAFSDIPDASGSLLWDQSVPLVLELRLSAWARGYEDPAESYEGGGVKEFYFRGERDLGDGVIARVEASLEYKPDDNSEMKVALRFKHWIEHPGSPTDGWAHPRANVVVDALLLDLHQNADLSAAHSFTLQLAPVEGGIKLLAFNGGTLAGEHLDRSGRTVIVPTALFPRVFDVYLRAQGVDVHSTPNSQAFSFVPNVEGATLSALSPVMAVAPFDLAPRTNEGGIAAVPQQYLFDAFFQPSPIPEGENIDEGWGSLNPFDLSLSPPTEFGRTGAFRFGAATSGEGQAPIYAWESAVTFDQRLSEGEIGDIAFDVGMFQDFVGGELNYNIPQNWPPTPELTTPWSVPIGVVYQEVNEWTQTWLHLAGKMDWFTPTSTIVFRRSSFGSSLGSVEFDPVVYGTPKHPSAIAADLEGDSFLIVYPSTHGVDTNNIVARGTSSTVGYALSKGGNLCKLRTAFLLPGGGFLVGGDNVIAYQTSPVGTGVADFTVASTPSGVNINGFCSQGSGLYAVGDNGAILFSSGAGATWVSLTSGVTSNLHGIASDGTQLVAVGEDRTVIVSGDSGVSWAPASKVGTLPLPASSGSFRCVAYGAGIWLLGEHDPINPAIYGTDDPAGEWFYRSRPPGEGDTAQITFAGEEGTFFPPTFAMTSSDTTNKVSFFTGVAVDYVAAPVAAIDTRTPVVLQWCIEDYGSAADKSAFERIIFKLEGRNPDPEGDHIIAWAELAVTVMDDETPPELEVSLSRYRETQAGVILDEQTTLGRVVGWEATDKITATVVVGAREPAAPASLSPGDLTVDVNGVGASVGWLSGAAEAPVSPSPGVPSYLSPTVRIFETRTGSSFIPTGEVIPRITFNSAADTIVPYAAHGGNLAGALSLAQALSERSSMLVPSSGGVVGARTIQRLSRLVGEDVDNDESEDFWIRILPETDFIGQVFDSDVFDRLYWASEGNGFRVDDLDNIYERSSIASLNVQEGFPVGVPSGDELIEDITITRVEPTVEQYAITHAGLLKVPAFSAKILEGDRVRTTLPSLGSQAVTATRRDVSYPETYYLLIRTATPDVRKPLGLAHDTIIQHTGGMAVDPLLSRDGDDSEPQGWVNIARDSQEKAFHYYPRAESDFSKQSAGVKLRKLSSPLFDGFPGNVALQHAIRSTVSHPLRPHQPLFAGSRDNTEYAGLDGFLKKIRFFFRSSIDATIPANWRFAADRARHASKSEARLPTTFAPVLITDPEKVFSRLYSRKINRYRWVQERRAVRVRDLLPGVEYSRLHSTTAIPIGYVLAKAAESTLVVARSGTKYDTPLKEGFLNRLWVFQVDAATFASMGSAGVAELLPGTHFTQAKPERRWVGDEVFKERNTKNKEFTPKGTRAGRSYARGLRALRAEGGTYDATRIADEWTTGPLLIDPKSSIDWSHIAVTTPAILEFESAEDLPETFNPATAPLETVEYAFVPTNIYNEEGPPRFLAAQRFSEFPTTRLSLEMSFSEALVREYRVSTIRVYRMEEDGVYYFLRSIDIPSDSADYAEELALGGLTRKDRPMISLNFDRPPLGVSNAVRMADGSILVADGREILPSESGFPHAFPRQKKQVLDFTVVGFGSFGDTVVACTTGQPYLIAGDSAALQIEKLDLDQACVSRSSIVSMGGDVIYASKEGLYSIGRGGIKSLTAGIADVDSWERLNPDTFRAYNWEGKYLCFFDSAGPEGAFMLDPEQLEQGLTFYSQRASAGFSQLDAPGFFFLENGTVYEWGESSSTQAWTWGSRFTRRSRDGNPGRLKVQCSRYPVTVSLWVDGKHQVCKEWAVLDDTAVALPSGLLGEEYYLRLKGAGDLLTVQFGDTIYDIQKG